MTTTPLDPTLYTNDTTHPLLPWASATPHSLSEKTPPLQSMTHSYPPAPSKPLSKSQPSSESTHSSQKQATHKNTHLHKKPPLNTLHRNRSLVLLHPPSIKLPSHDRKLQHKLQRLPKDLANRTLARPQQTRSQDIIQQLRMALRKRKDVRKGQNRVHAFPQNRRCCCYCTTTRSCRDRHPRNERIKVPAYGRVENVRRQSRHKRLRDETEMEEPLLWVDQRRKKRFRSQTSHSEERPKSAFDWGEKV